MPAHRITPTTIVAVLVALVAALFARAMIGIRLVERGYEPGFASDLAYLVVPVILSTLLFPVWRTEKDYLLAQFRLVCISWHLISCSILVGLLLRIAWWSQLIVGVSFGLYPAPDSADIVPLTIRFQCPPAAVLGLGLFVMALLVPLIEEIVYRGYLQSVLHRRGFLLSVLLSAILFTVFHRTSSWPMVFVAGCVFGAQYWFSRSLWPSLVSHGVYNALSQFDWRCVVGEWNPGPGQPGLFIPGVLGAISLVACAVVIIALVYKLTTGAREAPR